MFNRKFLQLVGVGLLLFFPATLFAAAAQISGTAGRGAIDTLTMEDGAAFGKVAGNVDMIIFRTDSLASATSTRNRVVFEGKQQLDCNLFRIQELGSDRFQINATGGRVIASLKLNGSELTTDSSKAGQVFQRNDSSENPSLPACGPVPSVSFYGLIVLALFLGATAIWLFRKRRSELA